MRNDNFQEFYSNQVLPVLQQIDEERRRSAKSVKNAALYSLMAGGVLAGILAAFWQVPGAGYNPCALAPLILIPIVTGIVYAQKAGEWKSRFKQEIIGRLVQFVGEGLRYFPQDGISRQEFGASRLFRTDIDRYNREDLLEGRVEKTAFRCSEVHAEYKTETTDSKGNRQTHWHTIFRGLFVIADFHKHFNGVTVVLPDVEQGLFGRFGQTLQAWAGKLGMTAGELVKLEDPEFEAAFKVYSTDQIEARYILSPGLMKRILEFRRQVNSTLHLSFIHSNLYLAIADTRNRLEAPGMFIATEKLLAPNLLMPYLQDIRFAVSIVDELNLNTRIWSKQ